MQQAMLTKAEPRDIELGANQEDSQNLNNLLKRKIWLPKFVYDVLPYFYLTAGFAAFFATLYINEWFWILPHYLLFSAACLHLGFAVRRRRTIDKDSGKAPWRPFALWRSPGGGKAPSP